MISIQHNMWAMNAQRQYKVNTDIKSKSTEKLSSGYKINRAADDAAGLTISEKMRSMIRALNQGTENTQDGISWCQIADGAMAEVHDMLHRMKELAVKSANGTNTDADRQAIDAEVQALIDEINRIDESTEFNTKPVFLRGNVVLDVEGEPGDLEYYNATKDGNNITYGGFLFHGQRIPFDGMTNEDGLPMVKMEDGVQVFNAGTYTYTTKDPHGNTTFFTLHAEDGAKVPDIKREIKMEASDEGIYVDGTPISWDNFYNEDGKSLNEVGPQYGTWHMQYGRSTVYFTVETNNSIRDKGEFVTAISHYCELQDNGGVAYKWTTEFTEEEAEKSVYVNDARFFNTSDNRTVDNAMAYDTNCDDVNEIGTKDNLNETMSGLGYVLRAVKVNSDDAEIAKYGTDTGVNIELFLVGSDGNKIKGSSQFVSLPDKETINPAINGTENYLDNLTGAHSISSFYSGTDITDGDYCNGNIKDGVTDFTYHYKDKSGTTDIEFDFRLSDISSADTVEDGLDLVKFVQVYDSEYKDSISKSSTANVKVNINNPGTAVYKPSYNMETALGRDFNDSKDVLAVIDGKNSGNEGKINYDADNHQISFSVMGNDIDKTSSNFSASQKTNNIGVLDFNGSTTEAEGKMTDSIISNANRLIYNKINSIINGKTDEVAGFSASLSARTVTLTDEDVESGKSDYDTNFVKDRSYEFDYNYADIFNVFNVGKTPGDTTDLGKKVEIKMENLQGTYNAKSNAPSLTDRWFKLEEGININGASRTKDQYVEGSELLSAINATIDTTNSRINANKYVYDELNKKYVTTSQYTSTLVGEIAGINNFNDNELAGNKTYVIMKGGSVREKGKLTTEYIEDYKGKLNSVISQIPTDGYTKTLEDEYSTVVPLSGDELKATLLSKFDLLTGLDEKSVNKIKSAIKNDIIDFSSISADADGKFSIGSIIDDDVIESFASDLAKEKVDGIIADKNALDVSNIGKLIDKSASPELKQILIDNYDATKLPKGEFTLDTKFKNTIFNPTIVAASAVNNAVVLSNAQPAGKEIDPNELKKLVLNPISSYNNPKSKDVSDFIKKYLDDNWDSVKGDLNIADGRISYSTDLIYKLRDAVVNKFTDGKIQTIRAYYDGGLADKEVIKDEFKGGTYTQKETGTAAVLKDQITKTATKYSSQAMQDIADSMKFTMEATQSSSTKMYTYAPRNSVDRPIYDTVVELEYNDSLYIQHSNILDDNTEIKKFCMNAAAMKISSVRANTIGSAKKAMAKIDNALAYVSDKRSYIGGMQNRLEHTYRNNENKAENLTAAESRIRDTDMSKEMMAYTKQNILMQVGEAMMSQANQSKQGVLSLLQ